MAATERVFAMPDLGEGLEEGEIVEWLVAEGEEVVLNQPLVEVETAKATVEIPSPFAGVVVSLHGAAGAAVPVGAPLVTFSSSDGGVGGGGSVGQTPPNSDSAATPDRQPSGPVAPGGAAPGAAPRATPPVRKLAKELGVELGSVVGSGPEGRVTAEDVRAAAGGATPAAGPSRAVIAGNLERQAAIPQVTTFRTVDCSVLEVLRAELGVSPLPIVIAALCRTVGTFPTLNSVWRGEGVVGRDDVHVGVAADTERGLVVPVLRHAHTLGVAELAAEISRLAEAARAGSLSPEELTGATIAVSNTGSYGSESGTPILAPGTAVTLAIGVIAPRALVVDGAVVARPACTLSCTFDHRVLDGATVGRALSHLVEILSSTEQSGALPR